MLVDLRQPVYAFLPLAWATVSFLVVLLTVRTESCRRGSLVDRMFLLAATAGTLAAITLAVVFIRLGFGLLSAAFDPSRSCDLGDCHADVRNPLPLLLLVAPHLMLLYFIGELHDRDTVDRQRAIR